MLAEQGSEDPIPAQYRWATLEAEEGTDLMQHDRKLLVDLGTSQNESVKATFANAQTSRF